MTMYCKHDLPVSQHCKDCLAELVLEKQLGVINESKAIEDLKLKLGMTTVTPPRETIKHWAERYGDFPTAPKVMQAMQAEINELRAALDAPAKPVDCRGCKHHYIVQMVTVFDTFERQTETDRCALHGCTDFDKFTALPPIVLTRVTK